MRFAYSKNIPHCIVVGLLFAVSYFAFGYYGKYMPWGRVDPIVALLYISKADPDFFSKGSFAFDALRPLNLWPYLIIAKSPFHGGQVWYLYKTILIALAGLGIYLFIYEFLKRKYILFPALVSLLYVINPVSGWEKINQVLLVSQFSAACIFLSYYFFLLSDSTDKKIYKTFTLATAFVLNMAGFLMYEVAGLLSAGIAVLLFICNHGRDNKQRNTTYYYLIVPALVFFYKVFFALSAGFLAEKYNLHSTLNKATLLLEPLPLLEKLICAYKTAVTVWGGVYHQLPKEGISYVNYTVILFFCLLAAVFLITVKDILTRRETVRIQCLFYLKSLLVGVLFSFLGYVPLLVASQYSLNYPSRMHDYASPGICVVVVSIAMILGLGARKWFKIAALCMVSVLIVIGTSSYHVMSKTLAKKGASEYGFWMDLVGRAPSFKDDTVIIVNGYPEKSFSPDTKSYYCNLILIGLYSNTNLKMVLFDNESEYKYSDMNFTIKSRFPLSERTCVGEIKSVRFQSRATDYLPMATQFRQLYYWAELGQNDFLPPEKEYSIPSERVVVFDYDPVINRLVLNEKRSNVSRILPAKRESSVFLNQFLGVADCAEVLQGKEMVEFGMDTIKYYADGGGHLNGTIAVLSKVRPLFGREAVHADVLNLTADGWITDRGIYLTIPFEWIRRNPKLVMDGDYPYQYLDGLTVSCGVIHPSLREMRIMPTSSFDAGHYIIKLDFSSVPDEYKINDKIVMKIMFNRYFVPKSLGLNLDTRKLVLQLPRNMTLEK